ncbi:YgdI/YgdR family lipoprotein [Thiosocius teredinicola]|uniref:hypothetical protein n=1 Tax=Thiosocius teredinicola TaxID=1973002 RepID=UPI0009913597
MQMKNLALAATLVLSACSSNQAHKYTKDGRLGTECWEGECQVTVAQLVITPERYHGKKVQVYGKLSVKYEAYGVLSGEHEVWVKLTDEQKRRFESLDGKKGFVSGVFDGFGTGHLGMWGGTIQDVTRFGP